ERLAVPPRLTERIELSNDLRPAHIARVAASPNVGLVRRPDVRLEKSLVQPIAMAQTAQRVLCRRLPEDTGASSPRNGLQLVRSDPGRCCTDPADAQGSRV